MWIIDKILGRTRSEKEPDKGIYTTDIPERDRPALLQEAEQRSFDMVEKSGADKPKTPPAH
jgi:hypothetical protein